MGTAVPIACPQSTANRHPTLLTHLHNMTMRTSLTAIRTAYRRSFGSRATPPVVDSILDTIGNTPVVRLNKLVQPWAQSNNLEAMLKLECQGSPCPEYARAGRVPRRTQTRNAHHRVFLWEHSHRTRHGMRC